MLSNKRAFENIQLVVRKSISENVYPQFDLESILTLYKRKVLTESDVLTAISRYGICSVSTKKRSYSDFIHQIWTKYKVEKNPDKKELLSNVFTAIILASRSHAIKWIHYSDKLRGKEFNDLIAKAYKVSFLKKSPVILRDTQRGLLDILGRSASEKFFCGDRKSEDIEELYSFFKEHGILKEVMSSRNLRINLAYDYVLNELEKCPIEVKDFFVRTCSIGSWAPVDRSSPKYRIVNEVNEYAYSKDGVGSKLVFNSCTLGKVISLDLQTYTI